MKTTTEEKPTTIAGGQHIDERGIVSFINDFDLTPIKRFYTISHPDTKVVRAWQGHKKEHKFFLVLKGSFLVAWVKIDNWKNPSEHLSAEIEILTSKDIKVLSLPPGYANGLKALEANSQLMVFSDKSLQDSSEDDIRFNGNLWLDWSQF